MTMRNGGQKLEHERFDFGLQEGGRHKGQEGFQVVLDEIHYNKYSILKWLKSTGVDIQALWSVLGKRFSHDYLTNSNNIVMSACHEGIYFAKGGDGEPILLFIEL
jgi:hypothetical protein